MGAAIRAVPLPAFAVAAAASVAVDRWLEVHGDKVPRVPHLAARDWSAHLVATALALRVLPPALADRLATPALVASVVIDADHLPIAARMLRGVDDLPRPRPHTFALPALLAAARRDGVAFGVAVHLARDLFNGPGVVVAWPFSPRSVRLSVTAEAVALAALLSAASRRSR